MERLLKIAFLGLLLFGVLPASAQEDQEKAVRAAKKYMQEAEEALAENDMATAEALYRKAIAKDPANAEARYNLGNIYYKNEITGEAVERHTQSAKVAEERPLKHDSYHNQGNAYMKQKKYKEAVEAYK
ncbi:MAG TPA: tetratricopeptide repeat protein, partial [Salinimicrobium catena]|nr:tetratricopeptide repeat protein [Salinimicrobium catena]